MFGYVLLLVLLANLSLSLTLSPDFIFGTQLLVHVLDLATFANMRVV